MSAPVLISLRDRGWRVIGRCVAIIRLQDGQGFVVGVQEAFCQGGTGRIWPSLKKARHRAAYLADLHKLPVVESI